MSVSQNFQQFIDRLEGGNNIIRSDNNIIKSKDLTAVTMGEVRTTILDDQEYMSCFPVCLDFHPLPQSDFIDVVNPCIFPVLPDVDEDESESSVLLDMSGLYLSILTILIGSDKF